jgi:2-dehydropantoate 2-reductase
MKAGSYEAFVSGTQHIRESYIAMRQAMETCRREGINPLAVSPTFLFYAPLFILAPFTASSYRTEAMRRMWEGHIAHSPEEMSVMYDDVFREGDRLSVAMPAYRAFAPHVERFLENIISQSKDGNNHD